LFGELAGEEKKIEMWGMGLSWQTATVDSQLFNA